MQLQEVGTFHLKSPVASISNPDSTSKDTSVMDEVLRTTELLEAILLELPVRDLLLANSVSKRFQQVIASSINIQQALFIRPEVRTAGIQRRLNPLFFSDGDGDWYKQLHLSLRNPSTGLLNIFTPLGPDTAARYAKLPLYEGPLQEIGGVTVLTEDHLGPRAIKKYDSGSWEAMYLTQPPESIVVGFSLDAVNSLLDSLVVGAVKMGEVLPMIQRDVIDYGLSASWDV